jgi:hypothetical protein
VNHITKCSFTEWILLQTLNILFIAVFTLAVTNSTEQNPSGRYQHFMHPGGSLLHQLR